MLKVLLLYLAYPLAMGTYFRRALERRTDVDLKVAGVYTGSWIPWMGGMELPKKYAIPVDIPLPFPPNIGEVNYDLVKAQLGDWKPDIIINVDAGLHWKYKPSEGYVVTVATDPHVLDYSTPRAYSNKFFNMQKVYSQRGDVYLPYAYDPTVHYPSQKYLFEDGTEGYAISSSSSVGVQQKELPKDADAVLGGMPYENRVQWVNELRKRGVSVLFENGPVFDEYREMNNRARIGLNWSSMDDLNARFFELPSMGLCAVMNDVPDAPIFLDRDVDYLGFSNLNEAIEKVLWAKNNPKDAEDIANRGYYKILPHTYDERIKEILKESGFIS